MTEKASRLKRLLATRLRPEGTSVPDAADPPLYDDLMRLARTKLRSEGHASLEPSDLVHEAFLRLADIEMSWSDRVHFLSMAARTMRRVLIDRARSRKADKRGGGDVMVSLSGEHVPHDTFEVLALHEALKRLTAQEERVGKVMELRCFGGLSYDEIAEAVGGSAATVGRDLRLARAWLRREMSAAGTAP